MSANKFYPIWLATTDVIFHIGPLLALAFLPFFAFWQSQSRAEAPLKHANAKNYLQFIHIFSAKKKEACVFFNPFLSSSHA